MDHGHRDRLTEEIRTRVFEPFFTHQAGAARGWAWPSRADLADTAGRMDVEPAAGQAGTRASGAARSSRPSAVEPTAAGRRRAA